MPLFTGVSILYIYVTTCIGYKEGIYYRTPLPFVTGVLAGMFFPWYCSFL